jgi:hypothetical protein
LEALYQAAAVAANSIRCDRLSEQNPRILLNSATDNHPKDLAGKNQLVGEFMITQSIGGPGRCSTRGHGADGGALAGSTKADKDGAATPPGRLRLPFAARPAAVGLGLNKP